ncbi:ZN106 protein, partial [Acromyrmex charruanus]
MSYSNFGRGRGYPQGTRAARRFGRPRFPRPPFRHAAPLPRPGHPAQFGVPWQPNNMFFQPHTPLRGSPPFRADGRRRRFCNYDVRFPAPNRLPVPPSFEETPVLPEEPILQETDTIETVPQLPLLGSEEERQQKIIETADRLKQKLSSFNTDDIPDIWNEDIPSNVIEDNTEDNAQRRIPVVGYKSSEINLTYNDLKDIGKINPDNTQCIANEFDITNNIDIINNTDNDVMILDENKDENHLMISNDQMTNLENVPDDNQYMEVDKEWIENGQGVDWELQEPVDNSQNLEQPDLHTDNIIENELLESDFQYHDTPLINISQEQDDQQQDISQGIEIYPTDVTKEPDEPETLNLQADVSFPIDSTDQDILQDVSQEKEELFENLQVQESALNSHVHAENSNSSNCTLTQTPLIDIPVSNVTLDNQLPRMKENSFQSGPPKLSPHTEQELPVDFDPTTPPPILLKQDQSCILPPYSIPDLPLFDPTEPPPNIKCLLGTKMPHEDANPPWSNAQNPIPAVYNNMEVHTGLNTHGGFMPQQLPLEIVNQSNVFMPSHIDSVNFSPMFPMLPSNPVVNTHVPSLPQVHAAPLNTCVSSSSLPELSSSSDLHCSINKDDGLNDMQEAMRFAKEMTSITGKTDEESKSSSKSYKSLSKSSTSIDPASDVESIALPPGKPKTKINKQKKVKESDTSSKKKISEEQNAADYPSSEETTQDANVKSKDAAALMNELERPKVVFNLNNKAKVVSTKSSWKENNEKKNGMTHSIEPEKTPATKIPSIEPEKPSAAKTPSIESEKTSSIESEKSPAAKTPSIIKKNLENTLLKHKKEEKNLKKKENNSENAISSEIANQNIILHHKKPQKDVHTEKSQHSNVSLPKVNVPNSRSRVEKNENSKMDASWKNRIISRFLKMSKNDIYNMVNNTSLRKFDIIMKRLVKEKKPTLSLEMRHAQDEKMKLYDQQEFMKQLNAMLDTDAIVSITDLPTEFIHHLNEVLQLDVQPDIQAESAAASSSQYEVTKKIQTPAAVKERKRCSMGQQSAKKFNVGAISRSMEKEAFMEDDRTHRLENSPHWDEKCDRWKRKEREDPHAYRNLTKEEWEARYGMQTDLTVCIPSNSIDSPKRIVVTKRGRGLLSRGRGRKVYPRRRYSSESSKQQLNTRHRSLEKEKYKKSRRHSDDRKHTTEYLEYDINQDSDSSSSSTSSSSSSNSSDNTNVTKLLRAIKENEKVAKQMSLNEAIRDEVNAEIERERKSRKSRKTYRSSKSRKQRKARYKKKKRQNKEMTSSSDSSSEKDNDDNETTDKLLTEKEIKKEVIENQVVQEVIVKEELDISQEENTRDAEFINASNHLMTMENKTAHFFSTSQNRVESPLAQEIPLTSINTTQLHAEERLPIGSPTQLKTKAQLKQMPETSDMNDNKVPLNAFTCIPENWNASNPASFSECTEDLNKTCETADASCSQDKTVLSTNDSVIEQSSIAHVSACSSEINENTILQQSDATACILTESSIKIQDSKSVAKISDTDNDTSKASTAATSASLVSSVPSASTASPKQGGSKKINIKTYYERTVQRRMNEKLESKKPAENPTTSTQNLITPKSIEPEIAVNKFTLTSTSSSSIQDPRLAPKRTEENSNRTVNNDNVVQKSNQIKSKDKEKSLAPSSVNVLPNVVTTSKIVASKAKKCSEVKNTATDKTLQSKVASDPKRFKNIRSEGSKELKLKKEMAKEQKAKKKSTTPSKSDNLISTKIYFPLEKTTSTEEKEKKINNINDTNKIKIKGIQSISSQNKVNTSNVKTSISSGNTDNDGHKKIRNITPEPDTSTASKIALKVPESKISNSIEKINKDISTEIQQSDTIKNIKLSLNNTDESSPFKGFLRETMMDFEQPNLFDVNYVTTNKECVTNEKSDKSDLTTDENREGHVRKSSSEIVTTILHSEVNDINIGRGNETDRQLTISKEGYTSCAGLVIKESMLLDNEEEIQSEVRSKDLISKLKTTIDPSLSDALEATISDDALRLPDCQRDCAEHLDNNIYLETNITAEKASCDKLPGFDSDEHLDNDIFYLDDRLQSTATFDTKDDECVHFSVDQQQSPEFDIMPAVIPEATIVTSCADLSRSEISKSEGKFDMKHISSTENNLLAGPSPMECSPTGSPRTLNVPTKAALKEAANLFLKSLSNVPTATKEVTLEILDKTQQNETDINYQTPTWRVEEQNNRKPSTPEIDNNTTAAQNAHNNMTAQVSLNVNKIPAHNGTRGGESVESVRKDVSVNANHNKSIVSPTNVEKRLHSNIQREPVVELLKMRELDKLLEKRSQENSEKIKEKVHEEKRSQETSARMREKDYEDRKKRNDSVLYRLKDKRQMKYRSKETLRKNSLVKRLKKMKRSGKIVGSTKEAVLARMLEIDLEIHKLVTEKLKLHELLRSNVPSSEKSMINDSVVLRTAENNTVPDQSEIPSTSQNSEINHAKQDRHVSPSKSSKLIKGRKRTLSSQDNENTSYTPRSKTPVIRWKKKPRLEQTVRQEKEGKYEEEENLNKVTKEQISTFVSKKIENDIIDTPENFQKSNAVKNNKARKDKTARKKTDKEADISSKRSIDSDKSTTDKSADERSECRDFTEGETERAKHFDTDKSNDISPPSEVAKVNSQPSNKHMHSTPESLSIYTDDSTWDSLVQNTASEIHKKASGLALLNETLKKELAMSQKMKSIVQKKKKEQLDNILRTVNNLTGEEEDLPLDQLYIKKLQQKRDLLDTLSQRKENLVESDILKNINETINTVAENKEENLFEPQSEARASDDIPPTSNVSPILQSDKHQILVDAEANANSDWPCREKENTEEVALQQDSNDVPDGSNHVFKAVSQDKVLFYSERNVEPDSSITPEETQAESHSSDCERDRVKNSNDVASRNFDIKVSVLKTLIKDDFSLGLLQKNKDTEDRTEVVDKDSTTNAFSPHIEKLEEKNENSQSTSQADNSIVEKHKKDEKDEAKDKHAERDSNVLEKTDTKQKKPDIESEFSNDTIAVTEDYQNENTTKAAKEEEKNNPENKSGIFEKILNNDQGSGSSVPVDLMNERSEDEVFVEQISGLEHTSTSIFSSNKAKGKDMSKKFRRKHDTSTPIRRSTRNSNENKSSKMNETDTNSSSSGPSSRETSVFHENDLTVRSRSKSPTWTKRDERVVNNIRKNRVSHKVQNTRKVSTESETKIENQASHLDTIIESAILKNRTKKRKQRTDWQMKHCKVRLIDCKSILYKYINPKVLGRLGIIIINPSAPNDSSCMQHITCNHNAAIIPTAASSKSFFDPTKSCDKEKSEIEILEEKSTTESSEKDLVQEPVSHTVESNEDESARMQYTVHKGPILDLKIFENSFLAASEDGKIYRYSQKFNGILNIYKGHKSAVTCLYIYKSDDAGVEKNLMYSGSLDGTLRCYKIMTGALVGNPAQTKSPIQCMDQAWGMIFIGTKSGHVSRFYIEAGAIKEDSIPFSEKSVLALKATNEGPRRILIIASRNQPINIRDALTGLLLRMISGQNNSTVYSLLRHDNLIYCGTSSTSINVFDFTAITQYEAGVGIVCMRLYKQLLFAGCYDGNIYVFDINNHKLIHSIRGPGNMLLSVEVVNNKIIAGSKDKRLHMWQMPTQVRALL